MLCCKKGGQCALTFQVSIRNSNVLFQKENRYFPTNFQILEDFLTSPHAISPNFSTDHSIKLFLKTRGSFNQIHNEL